MLYMISVAKKVNGRWDNLFRLDSVGYWDWERIYNELVTRFPESEGWNVCVMVTEGTYTVIRGEM